MKAEVYHQKSWPPTGLSKAKATPEMHSMKSLDKPRKKTKLPAGNKKILAEKHSDEEAVLTLLIVRNGIIAYHFW